jgi:nucleoside-diphosphate-sugar epimerase
VLAVVTGAGGFIGRAVCERFIAAGWRVRGLTRRPAPASGVAATAEWLQVDLERDIPSTALAGADAIVHLAGRAHILEEKSADPRQAFQAANTQATARLARAGALAGIRRLLFVSSVKVHGDQSPGRPLTERDEPRPQDEYGRSKRDAEQQLRQILPESVILRPPLVYGPGVGANFLRLVKLVDSGIPLPLASVRNYRSLVFVHNLADCIFTCATQQAASGRTFLVSDGEDLSTPQLLRRIAELLGRPARLWPCPPALLKMGAAIVGKSEEADRVLGSLSVDSASLRVMGWSPPHSLSEGLRQTIQWYRSEYPKAG